MTRNETKRLGFIFIVAALACFGFGLYAGFNLAIITHPPDNNTETDDDYHATIADIRKDIRDLYQYHLNHTDKHKAHIKDIRDLYQLHIDHHAKHQRKEP